MTFVVPGWWDFATTDPEERDILAAKYGAVTFDDYQELIRNHDINIIAVATPSGFHLEPTVFAATQGKHVICEKPLEVTLERIDSMIEAHERSGTYLGGIFPYRYNDSFEVLKKAIKEGRFGRISFAGIQVPWWRNGEYYQDSWHGTWELDGGGALMNQSIHMIDYLLALMGPVQDVQGYIDHLGHLGIEAEDTAVAILRFEKSVVGIGIWHYRIISWPVQKTSNYRNQWYSDPGRRQL